MEEKYIFNKKVIIFSILTAMTAVCIYRFFILKYFSSVFTDHDQVLMWLAATDYKNFSFYEPCFYGQNYNVMIEALLAVPFLFSGISHNYALPLSTSFVALFPAFFISFYCLKKHWYLTAFFSAVIPLAMPLRFHLISSMPRGFVTGPAIAAVAMIIVLAGKSQWRFFWFGLLGVFSFVVLPSAALIMIPVGAYVLLSHWREVRSMGLLLGGCAIGVVLYLLKNAFYVLNPAYNEYNRMEGAFIFSIDVMLRNLQNYHDFFYDVTPAFFANNYVLVILFIIILSWVLLKEKKFIKLFVFIFSITIIFATLGFSKVTDGTNSIFFPYSRYYFSVFYLFIFYVWLVDEKFSFLLINKKYSNVILIFSVLSFTVMSFLNLSEISDLNIKEEMMMQKGVVVDKTENVYSDSEKLKNISEKFGAELIIGNNFLLNYAFPALYPDATPTLLLPVGSERLERRTWRIAEEFTAIRDRIILINFKNIYDESHIYPFQKVVYTDRLSDSTIYVIENVRAYTTKKFLYSLGQELTF